MYTDLFFRGNFLLSDQNDEKTDNVIIITTCNNSGVI